MSSNKSPQIEHVAIDDVRPNPENPRKITDKKIELLSQSMKALPKMIQHRFIVADRSTGFILGGNQRWQAAKKLGWDKIPVVYADSLTEQERKEFIIRDNIESGEWDEKALESNFQDFPLVQWGLIPDMGGKQERERDTSDIAAAKEVYDNAETKQIVAYFDAKTYAKIHDSLEQIKEENYFGTNGSVLLFLIHNYA